MDELIILIIKGLVRLFGGDPEPKRTPTNAPRNRGPQVQGQPPGLSPALAAAIESLQQPGRRGKRPGQRRPVPPTSLPAPLAAARLPEVVESVTPATSAAHGTAAAAATSSANAAALRRWLTPAVLRKQFIVTEILRPPLALREE